MGSTLGKIGGGKEDDFTGGQEAKGAAKVGLGALSGGLKSYDDEQKNISAQRKDPGINIPQINPQDLFFYGGG